MTHFIRRSLVVLLVAGGAGCTGTVGESSGSGGGTSTGTGGSSSGTGGSSTPGSGGSSTPGSGGSSTPGSGGSGGSGTGGAVVVSNCAPGVPASSQIPRLT